MTFEDLLEQIENAVDSGTNVAFTNKTMVDTKAIKTCLEDMRLNLPVEIAQARKVLAEHARLVQAAKGARAPVKTAAAKRAPVKVATRSGAITNTRYTSLDASSF